MSKLTGMERLDEMFKTDIFTKVRDNPEFKEKLDRENREHIEAKKRKYDAIKREYRYYFSPDYKPEDMH